MFQNTTNRKLDFPTRNNLFRVTFRPNNTVLTQGYVIPGFDSSLSGSKIDRNKDCLSSWGNGSSAPGLTCALLSEGYSVAHSPIAAGFSDAKLLPLLSTREKEKPRQRSQNSQILNNAVIMETGEGQQSKQKSLERKDRKERWRIKANVHINS